MEGNCNFLSHDWDFFPPAKLSLYLNSDFFLAIMRHKLKIVRNYFFILSISGEKKQLQNVNSEFREQRPNFEM